MLLSFLPFIGLAVACSDNKIHPRASSHVFASYDRCSNIQPPLVPPYRPLVWGDFNVIHTTDMHGWLLGHQKCSWPEPNYNGDLGDFASFFEHMNQTAFSKDVDLLLIDTGDLHDGTGLSDGYPPGGVDGHESDKFVQRLPYDLMTIGNHELYNYSVTFDMYTNFIPYLNGRYLSSNANITIFDPNGNPTNAPIGNRYTKFWTRKGRRVTSLGVLFNMTGKNAAYTTVQAPKDMVNETWFAEAIAEEPDVFVLIGHMPVPSDDPDNQYSIVGQDVVGAVRNVHPTTPILVFGGHSHVRYCQQFNDSRTVALESGRFMETIGWMSTNLSAAIANSSSPIAFSRRYLDQNNVTYEYHTNTTDANFTTDLGSSITGGLEELATNFGLTTIYGNSPQDYSFTWDNSSLNGSVWYFFITEAAPYVLSQNNPLAVNPSIIIVNEGVIRYGIFEGNFTKDDELTAMPYPNQFIYIPAVPADAAKQVLDKLNNATNSAPESSRLQDKHIGSRYHNWLGDMDKRQAEQMAWNTPNPTLGYVTVDECDLTPNQSDPGDDIVHTKVPDVIWPPTYIGSNPPDTNDAIDLVFENYTSLNNQVLNILNELTQKNYTTANMTQYSSVTCNEVLGLYAQAKWST